MLKYLLTTGVILSFLVLSQCSRRTCDCVPPPSVPEPQKLLYSDSVFYLQKDDYTVKPLGSRSGTYTAFPNNLQINRTTGAITVTQKGTDGESQTGMWYKIIYTAPSGEMDSAFLLLSGLTYVDRFYNLAANDSIIHPIYNANPDNPVPQGNYDLTSDNKFAINAVNGQINIKECMRRGFFSSGQTGNSSWKIATIKYAIKDKSQSATNKIDVVLYYYSTMSDVPRNVSALMQAHQQMTLGMRSLPVIPSTNGAVDNDLPSNLSLSKPRPPCLIIIGH